MSKLTGIALISTLFCFQSGAWADTTYQLLDLDTQRDNLLKEMTASFVYGKISLADAQQLKSEMDDIVKIETTAQEDKVITAAEYNTISNALEQTRTHVNADTHKQKVWMGINADDSTLRKKISDALAARKISKEQANDLMEEEEKLRARESNGSPSNQFEFTDAISIANDLLALDGKIDELASAGHTE